MSIRRLSILLAVSWCAWGSRAHGDEVLVATASNFISVAERLEVDFEAATGHDLLLVSGSTGKLYAQIVSGAPFEILLAADQRRPERLVADGRGVAASLRTYAVGRLVLWSPDPKRVASEGEQTLRGASFRRLALANPDLAPYGVAAREVLTALGLEGLLANRLVMGENIGQAYALVATGNAELGLLAASQQMRPGVSPSGSRWLVPADLHGPIRQDVVLLRHASQSVGARAFLDYLSSSQAKHIIRSFGYDVD